MTAEVWAKTLLADDSDTTLLVWADWLEEQGDEACEGVRWLVKEGKRPDYYGPHPIKGDAHEWLWSSTFYEQDAQNKRAGYLPRGMFLMLPKQKGSNTFGCWYYGGKQYHGQSNVADAHYAALFDAARAYVTSRYLTADPASV